MKILRLKITKLLFTLTSALLVAFVACGGGSGAEMFLRAICGMALFEEDVFTLVGANGFSAYTQNGGLDFTKDSPGSTSSLTDAVTNNGLTWATGSGGMLYQKLGVDAPYINVDSSTSADLKDLEWLSSDVGLAVGSGGTVIKTTDAGLNWTESIIGNKDLYSLDCFNSSKCWAVGAAGAAYKTDDAGDNWLDVSSRLDFDLSVNAIYTSKLSTDRLWLAGAGGYFSSSLDGGESFARIDPGTSHDLYAVYFESEESAGLLAGDNYVGRVSLSDAFEASIEDVSLLFEEGLRFKRIIRSLTNTFYLMGTQGSLYRAENLAETVLKIPVIYGGVGSGPADMTDTAGDDSDNSGGDFVDESGGDFVDDGGTPPEVIESEDDSTDTATGTASFVLSDQDFSFSHSVGSTECPQKVGQFVITNDGTQALAMAISPRSGTPVVADPSGGFTLQPGESRTIMLFFTCAQASSFQGQLDISGISAQGLSTDVAVQVSGNVG